MKHQRSYLFLAGGLLLGLALYQIGAAGSRPQQPAAQPAAQREPEAKAAGNQESEAAKEAVMANVRTFTEAFNRRDMPALLKLFADDCVLTEADGTMIHGLKQLEEEFKESFEDDPDGKISVSVDLLRQVAPDVIIEEGKTEFFPDGKILTAETDYQAIHVKRGDRWLMKRVRSFNRVVLSPYDSLRELEFLVGDWIDESPDSLVESSYRWDDNKTFLLQKFTIRVNGQKVLSGSQRIGRDPLTKQIKGWVFDSEGGYAESLWANVDDSWVIKGKGVRADGKVVTVTNQLTQLGKDRISFESVDRIVGEERMPNMAAIIVRKPPQPTKK
jgi:uncharacterized protein (TIGR02246 family)